MKYTSRATALVIVTALFFGPTFVFAQVPPIEPPPVSPPTDTTAPVISGVVNQSVLSTAATVVWVTDELSASTFEYGSTQNYGSSASISASLTIGGTAALTGLTPSTTYYYCIHAHDAANNASQSCNSFTTAAAADTAAPVISGVANISLLSNTAEIVWTTDELAVSHVRYGTSESLGTATLPATALLAHAAVVTGLTHDTTYHYCIDATDVANNTSTSCGHTFTTASLSLPSSGDTNPPTVSIVSVSPITSSTATITWSTNEVADAQVEYGLTADYGSITVLDTNLALTHSVALTSLTPNTLYHYRVRSSDELGNVAVTSDETFTAAPLSGSRGGTASVSGSGGSSSVAVSTIESSSITTTSVTITWTTDLLSDSQVEYGTSELFGSATPLNSALTTSHSVSISGLSANTNYIFRVKSKPAGASVAVVSTTYEFNTLADPQPLTQPANVSSVAAVSITTSAASVSWNTDAAATSYVEYGISSAYGQLRTLGSSLATSHTVALSNLTANTLYHYRVKSVTDAGDITYSDDHTFTTGVVSGSVGQAAPIEIATLSVSSHDSTSAMLAWHVDSPDTDTAAQYEIRYATYQINSASYAQATLAQETPVDYVDLSPSGVSRSYIVAGLDPNTTYHFALKSKYQNSAWSGISTITSVTTSPAQAARSVVVSGGGGGGGGGGLTSTSHAPTIVSATGEDSQIVFNLKNPKEDSYVHTVIVRKKEGSYPTSPTDGMAIYEGRSETFTDTNLTNGKTYYYSIYSFDHAKNYSSPTHVSLAPKGGVNEVQLRENPELVSTGPIEHFVKTYKKGDSDIEIEHLQQLLLSQGIYNYTRITGYFGTRTEAGLKALQAKYKLPQSGVTDDATRDLLTKLSQEQVTLGVPKDVSLLSTNLRIGANGDAVEALQEFLIREGSYGGSVTGVFAASTKTAVMAFQKKYNVQPVSGYVGPKTRHVMQTISGL